tara:strand:- start:844 stop:2367 length:1524 start_codon:yes stop_codon:yes gene_type:complete
MALVTDKFRIYAAEAFRNTLGSTGSDANKVYLFVGRPKAWGNPDSPPTNEPIDSFTYHRQTYGDSVAFKRVDITDTSLVVPRVDWIDPTETTGGTGRTYSMYKPDYSPAKTTANGATRLYDSNFYVMNSDFNVYKCLYNGQSPTYPRGRPSLIQPTGTSTTVIETNDSSEYKYRWKYMYTIDADNILKFVTTEFIPVIENSLVQAAAGAGSIDTVVIENAGQGYNNDTYTNVPIRGDWSINGGTQAYASVTVESGSVTNVTVTNSGSKYSFGTIDVGLIPNIGAGGSGADLDVIIPPNGGHGADVIREIGAYRLMFASKLETSTAFVDFPTDLTFRRVGLVLNPYDYKTTTISDQNTRSAIKAMIFPQSGTGMPSGTFTAGTTITQNTTNAKGYIVSYDSTTKVLRYYQDSTDGLTSGNIVEFSGNYEITSSNLITATPNQTFGTSQNPVTQITIGVSVYELGLSFVEGYANGEVEINSGEILYIDNRNPITRSADQNEELKVVIEF